MTRSSSGQPVYGSKSIDYQSTTTDQSVSIPQITAPLLTCSDSATDSLTRHLATFRHATADSATHCTASTATHCTTHAENGQKQAQKQLENQPNLCPDSRIVTATDSAEGLRYAIFSPCNRWNCVECGPRKKHDWTVRIQAAAPTRFLTLTVKTGDFATPREAYDLTRRKCSELFRHFKATKRPAEYVRILEETKAGFPHYHYLTRSDHFWPQAEISSVWKRLTGSWIVDIQYVADEIRHVQYVAKYLQKADHVSFTNRRITYSRRFFPPKPPKQKSTLVNFCQYQGAMAQIWLDTQLDNLIPTDRMGVFVIRTKPHHDRLPGEDPPESILQLLDSWIDRCTGD